MTYIVIAPGTDPVTTNWFNPAEYIKGSLVINISSKTYTKDGKTWREIEKK
jgi:hypothetical protein